MDEEAKKAPEAFDHDDVVAAHHRFANVTFRGQAWDLSHLDAFALRAELPLANVMVPVDVVVLFSCHCFTQEVKHDGRAEHEIPADELYVDSRETRVLNEERYNLSRRFLRALIVDLTNRTIQVADPTRPNFITVEVLDDEGQRLQYAVFFEVEKDRSRKKRLLLRVQSAYVLPALTKRQRQAGKVRLTTLLAATYEGRKIKG